MVLSDILMYVYRVLCVQDSCVNAAALLVDELRLKAELAVLQREKADGEWLRIYCGYSG